MISLIFSVLALFLGVGLYPVIKRRPSWLSFFDAFVFVSITGLTLFHLIPHSVENAGMLGVLALGVGLGVPVFLHRSRFFGHSRLHGMHGGHEGEDAEDAEASGGEGCGGHAVRGKAILLVAFVGVCVHTLLDGIGLSMSSMDGDGASVGKLVGLGILFHRMPVGFFLSLLLVPMIGLRKTWGVVLSLALTTVVGFLLGHYAVPHAGIVFLNILQGVIAGSLLHIIFHNTSVGGACEFKYAKGLGAIVGIGAFAFVTWGAPVHAGHGEGGHGDVMSTWLSLILEAAPLWCGFALVLVVSYALTRMSSERCRRIGNWVCARLDPQPRPVAAGGGTHVFSAVGIILMWTLCDGGYAAAWLAALWVAVVVTDAVYARPSACMTCVREGHCDVDKGFWLWTEGSFGRMVSILVMASCGIYVAAPVSSWIGEWGETPRVVAVWVALAVYAVVLAFLERRPHAGHCDAPGVEMQVGWLFVVLVVLHGVGMGEVMRLAVTLVAGLCALLALGYGESVLSLPGRRGRYRGFYPVLMGIPVALMLGIGLWVSPVMSDDVGRFERFSWGISQEIVHVVREAVEESGEAHEGHGHHGGGAWVPQEVMDTHLGEGVESDGDVHATDHAAWVGVWFFKVICAIVFGVIGLLWVFLRGPREVFSLSEGERHHRHEVH